MVNYRYIGKGTTDNNGIAHLTEDAEGQSVDGYVGVGAGELGFVCFNKERTLSSEIYVVLDAIFVDSANCTNHPYNSNTTAEWVDDYWNIHMNGVSGTYFDIIHTDRGAYGHYVPLNSIKGQKITVEFDYKTTSNGIRFTPYHDIGNGWQLIEATTPLTNTDDEWEHFSKTYTFSSNAIKVWLRLQNNATEVDYQIKNLRVYLD